MDDERAIRELIATWLEASRRGDVEAVLALMSDDVVFLVAGHEPFGKKEFAAQSRAMEKTSFEGESRVDEVRVLGEWAYCRTTLTVRVKKPDGEVMTRAGNTLSVLKKESRRWVIARDANMLTAR